MKRLGVDTSITEGKIRVMKAFAAGRTVVVRHKAEPANYEGSWEICDDPSWNWGNFMYDITVED